MKYIVPVALVLIAVAACATVIFVKALKPNSGGAFLLFAAWLALPYAIMGAALTWGRQKGITSIHLHVVAALVSVGGIVFLADVIIWQPDAQGAIAVLLTPIFQGCAFALLLPIASWVSRIARA